MNSLSWMIYGAGVLGNMQAVLVIASIFSGIGVVAYIVIAAARASVDDVPSGTWVKGAKWAWLPMAFAIVSSLIPSSSTIYLMAASEAGEAVVSSPDAKDMLNDLKSIIRKKLKEELSADNSENT